MTGRVLLCALALVVSGCTQAVSGVATRPVPAVDENSRSPVDVDTVLLDRSQMQALSGAGTDLTAVPGMESKVPVDIPIDQGFLPGSVSRDLPPQCGWLFAETEVFGPDIEEFHKTTYQSPRRGGLLSQAAAGYRDTATAHAALTDLTRQIGACGDSAQGATLVGEVAATGDSVRIRPGACGRDYRVKSVVMIEVTFCSFPDSVPDLVMTNIADNVPG
ncbi:sensor domain-containing protein [Mycolicibacterium sp. 018/SC-01/001]|uniref:sensor domain-containing protein n=1 Tax=Mycolicibacterium sp. 018/SC-01/001 TaxID=2592069 RepID=UPI00117D5A3A|nr:sensor domain-containing protein [Mycolicibacterium sp. 018/SC-01/001]TRW81446.1 sensor domain-containing protein [Mycolicibacterium sp. 018/SC-01/001]